MFGIGSKQVSRTGHDCGLNHRGLSYSLVVKKHNKAIEQKDTSGCWMEDGSEGSRKGKQVITVAQKLKMTVAWIRVVAVEMEKKAYGFGIYFRGGNDRTFASELEMSNE